MGSLLDEIYDAEHLLCKGFHEINSKESLDKNTLEMMGELLDAAKDFYEVTMKAEYPEYSQGNYSRNDYPMRGYSRDDYSMNYPMRNSYDGNQSYARRRDSRGRYSRGDDLIARLEEKMNNATTDQEREKYRKMIIEMENM